MTTIRPAPATDAGTDDKIGVPADEHRIEHAEMTAGGVLPMVGKDNVDAFGSHTKVDPAEIALVKKLDMYMLVSILSSEHIGERIY